MESQLANRHRGPLKNIYKKFAVNKLKITVVDILDVTRNTENQLLIYTKSTTSTDSHSKSTLKSSTHHMTTLTRESTTAETNKNSHQKSYA